MRIPRSSPRRLAAATLVAGASLAMPAAPAVARPASNGTATVASVDGPGRLTLKTKGGALKVRLFLIDTPEPGECGAAESTATLAKLAKRRGGRVRYVLWSRRPDAEGRLEAMVGPRKADLTEHSLAADLVAREWARVGRVVTISESDGIALSVTGESWTPRAPRGVWAICGGLMHLPLGEPAPAHAPATWMVDADGITSSIGPITLPTSLAPGTALTVADVARVARVEMTDLGEGACWARVPSLEIIVYANAYATAPCSTADVYAIATSGPGVASSSRGLRAGQRASEAPPLFPRLAATKPAEFDAQDRLQLAGYTSVPWAWQTLATVDTKHGRITGFGTSTARLAD